MLRLDIKMLEKFSGLKAHTIRAWEHRFHVLKPLRTAGNRRYYSTGDLKILLDFALLTRFGSPISKLLQLSPDDLAQKIVLLRSTAAGRDVYLNELIVSFVSSDVVGFEKILSDYSKRSGIHSTVSDLIVPFIENAGLYYYINQHSSMHFAVTAIRRKLYCAIEDLPDNANSRRVLLFLPARQHFDLMLIYLSYLLRGAGYDVVYLGTNVPNDILESVCDQYDPALLISYLVPAGKAYADDLESLTAISRLHKNLLVCTADGTAAKNAGIREVHYGEILPYLAHFVDLDYK